MSRTIRQLATRLQVVSQADTTDYATVELEDRIIDAVRDLFPDKIPSDESDMADRTTYTFGLTPDEETAVIYRAWINWCYTEASRFARSYTIDSPIGETKKQEMVDNYLKLASKLEDKLDDHLEDNNLDVSKQVHITTVTRSDRILGTVTKNLAPVPSSTASDFAATVSGGTVGFTWTNQKINDFNAYYIVRNSSSGVRDKTRDNSGATIPGVSSDSEIVATLYKQFREGYSTDTLDSGTYYMILVTQTKGDRYTYSNEITVVVP